MSLPELVTSLNIEKMVFRGYGLGHAAGQTVLVNNAVPGDVVDARILHHRGKAALAVIERYRQHSPLSQPAPCQAFAQCGGCDWLHLPYEHQLAFKQQMMEQLLAELPGALEHLAPIIGSPLQTRYRNKSFLPVSLQNGAPVVGMYARRSHSVVPHSDCRLQPPLFDRIAHTFRSYLVSARVAPYNETDHTGACRFLGIRAADGQAVVTVVTRGGKLPFTQQLVRMLTTEHPEVTGVVQNINRKPGNVILGDEEKVLWGSPWLQERLGDRVYRVHYRSFFQVNTAQTPAMYNALRGLVDDGATVIDAFAGAGAIGLYVSDRASRVWCVESNPAACEDARVNIGLNHATHCTVVQGQVEAEVPRLCREQVIDTIIFDPPRKGLEPGTISAVASAPLRRVLYVSCNPATQVRDARLLLSHGFAVRLAQPFDMFPQTHHIENLMVLERDL